MNEGIERRVMLVLSVSTVAAHVHVLCLSLLRYVGVAAPVPCPVHSPVAAGVRARHTSRYWKVGPKAVLYSGCCWLVQVVRSASEQVGFVYSRNAFVLERKKTKAKHKLKRVEG